MTISNLTFDIRDLIPQRAPILVVDRLVETDGQSAVTSFVIKEGLVFLEDDGTMAEVGLIENIAQSASALAGYRAKQNGSVNPPVGYIGEIKNFRLFDNPRVGDELLTTVTFGTEVAGVTLIEGEVRVGDKLMAKTRMKIFVA